MRKTTLILLLLSLIFGCTTTNKITSEKMIAGSYEYSINEKKNVILRLYSFSSSKLLLENEKQLYTDQWIVHIDTDSIGYGLYQDDNKNSWACTDYKIDNYENGYLYEKMDYTYNEEYVFYIKVLFKDSDNPVIFENPLLFSDMKFENIEKACFMTVEIYNN